MIAPLGRASSRPHPTKHATKCLIATVVVMHTVVMVYLATLTTLLQTATAADLVTIRVYEPYVTPVLYALAGSHFREIVTTVCVRPKAASRVGPTVRAVPSRPRRKRIRQAFDKWFDHLILVFNSVETASQCCQAYSMFQNLVDPSKVISYAVIVILYCCVSPLILLIRNTQAKTSIVNLADAIVCFTLSCGHPFAAVTIQLVEYTLLNPNLGNDNLRELTCRHTGRAAQVGS
ncbi:hypothetical protein H310_11564 [Aphanomyces invadans]|uniref:Uncharacterized protein n=1 Tax=Aphanomyces invadans TaxID=157072 RepID=A0A024TLN7_9STRA|nr:hypothetical protein H310_11564 [Aphanomyces invadans]ETV94918.1 hypothetical protein H310_11564 [Aphanomyces invadans]|eukprot:XP_008876509.1 hypothetical protein H310_11564 [Aphanomyces invadans]